MNTKIDEISRRWGDHRVGCHARGAHRHATCPARLESPGPVRGGDGHFSHSSLCPSTPKTIERLAHLAPRTLALMHGSSFTGDCAGALRALAHNYGERLGAAAA